MSVDKLISFHIERQFPAIYREDGQELVQFVKEYYKFLETSPNQAIYNGRRIFEYRDIDTTLERMLIFFKNKYLSELPFDDNTVRIIVKNILGLYRRKGTQAGLEVFFRLFYNEDVKVYYPARDILKPSDSAWQKGNYLQMSPNSGIFTSTKLEGRFTYKDIVGKTIIGEASRAKATVDKINFIILNNTLTPIIFINDIIGNFIGLEGIVSEINGVPINFGVINGSLTNIEIDDSYAGTFGNRVGDLVTFVPEGQGSGARGLVTEVTESFTGVVRYAVEDGGWGYTIDNTKLIVSDQIIFLDNAGGKFEVLEGLEDNFGNRGIVVGQNDITVGVKMDPGKEFTNNSIISTTDRDVNVTIDSISGPGTIVRVVEKNDSSPGDLFPDTANTADVIVGELTNTETVSLIFDVIGDYVNVSLDSSNYNDPPAAKPMSGTSNPVNINTTLDNAFDLTPIELGTIVRFDNINPGEAYVNDVFAIAYDPAVSLFTLKNQFITLENLPATLNAGDEISQNGIKAKVIAINSNTLTVRPYTYYGFSSNTSITFGGIEWDVAAISTDFTSENAGFNATINAVTDFAVGRITAVNVIDSGYGYINNTQVDVIDSDGNVAAKGTISARGQGSTGGYWSSLNSHLNGYVSRNGSLDYFQSGKFIQDSRYYQEYSYEIRSKLDLNTYEESLKEITHVAGTKVFGRFNLEENVSTPVSSDIEIVSEVS